MKQRNFYIDLLRYLACLMVIMIHSPNPNTGYYEDMFPTIFVCCSPCIGLFFMISGFLILPLEDSVQEFLRHRSMRVIIPAVVWTLVYMLENDLFMGGYTMRQRIFTLLAIPFSVQGNGVLWFVYTLMGLYLLTPVISPWLKEVPRRWLRVALILWLVSSTYTELSKWLYIDTKNNILQYFSGYVGYYVLGYYLRKYVPRIPIWAACLLILIPLGFFLTCKVLDLQINYVVHFAYLDFLTIMMCVGWFFLMKELSPKLITVKWLYRSVISFSNLSFGIYLGHVLILRQVVWRIHFFAAWDAGCQIAVTFLLAVLLSWLFTYAVSYLPFGRFIVGYQHRRK